MTYRLRPDGKQFVVIAAAVTANLARSSAISWSHSRCLSDLSIQIQSGQELETVDDLVDNFPLRVQAHTDKIKAIGRGGGDGCAVRCIIVSLEQRCGIDREL
ncbi:MAG TPA: hypothetical protein VHT52_02875 [Stellaceae bacterium]|jgi:hypothetical protein|nr:hypothetical protein [Stellaceae bacterium]